MTFGNWEEGSPGMSGTPQGIDASLAAGDATGDGTVKQVEIFDP